MVCFERGYQREQANRFGVLRLQEKSNGSLYTSFEYRIPFPSEIETSVMAMYGVPHEGRRQFYQSVAYCISQQVKAADYLSRMGVPGILKYDKVFQEKTDDGMTVITLETEPVLPFTSLYQGGAVSKLYLLDLLNRLSVITRDIHKEVVGVSHRGPDMNEVYVSQEGKILLGGFYYSSLPGSARIPAYLNVRSPHLAAEWLAGNAGDQASDMNALAKIGWNLFSGLPFDVPVLSGRKVYPAFANDEIAEALLFGMSCSDTECNKFRRMLTNARKHMSKLDEAAYPVPIRSSLRKTVRINENVIPSGSPGKINK